MNAILLAVPAVRRLSWRWAGFLAIAFGFALVVSVGMDHPIQNNNEGLYASVARDMLASHSWIVPTLDGVPYLEKPPMLYWVTAISYALFGVSEVSSRAAPVVGLLLVLSAVYWFARREWEERTALAAACLVASSPLFVGMGRVLMFDMLFTGLYSWALVAMYQALAHGAGRRWMRVGYGALALAVLTKGLVALVFFGAMALALLLIMPARVRREAVRVLFDPAGLALFAAIAVPWHVLAWREVPEFGWFYFVNEHLLRFLGAREPRDYYHGPWWYYVPRAAAALFPWALLALVPPRREADDGAAGRFLWASFLVPLVFFSLSGAKANYYMIVALPSAALLLARHAGRLWDSGWLAVVPLFWLLLFGVLDVAGPALAAPAQWPASAARLLGAGCSICVAALALVALRRSGAAIVATAAVAIPLAVLFSDYLKANEGESSARRIAQEARAEGLQRIFVFRDFESMSALAFYVREPIGVIDSRSNDLGFGLRLRPDPDRFPSIERFSALEARPGVGIVVANSRRADFERTPVRGQFAPVWSSSRVTLYAWRGPSRMRSAVAAAARSAG